MSSTTQPPSKTAPAQNGEDTLYEVIDGKRVEKPPMGYYESGIASLLGMYLGQWAQTHQLGRARVETIFRMVPSRSTERRPDVAYVSYQRWPKDRIMPRTSAWEVVPDLAVEIVSPTNRAQKVLDKVHEYFQAGVRQVWVIYPDTQEVYVYEAPTRVRIVDRSAELEGGDILPNFRLAVATLFEDEREPAPPSENDE